MSDDRRHSHDSVQLPVQESSSTPVDVRVHPPVLMNEQEVAIFLGVCPRSVRNFTTRKLIPVIRLGRRRLFRRDAVVAALQKLER